MDIMILRNSTNCTKHCRKAATTCGMQTDFLW